MQKMFRYPIFSETQKVSPTMFFDTVRHQLFDGQLWCPLFLLSLKIFDARSFLNHRREHLQSFSALWEKRYPTEISVITLLCKRSFDARIFLKHGRIPYESFRRCETNFFQLKLVLCRSYPYDFSVPDFSETQKGSPTKIFGKVRQEFLKKNCDKPRLLLSKKNCETKNFPKHEVFPHEIFRRFETKIFNWN